MLQKRSLVSALALCIAAISANAQQRSQTLDSIVVTANRSPQPASRVGQTLSVIDAQTLRRLQSATVADALRSTPGLSVARSGGVGTATSVFIRGADSDQTVILIDGVKLNDPSSPGGGFNFGNLLLGNIDQVEVLRGAQSTLWGSQAIGGVINVRTRQATDETQIHARAEVGYRGTKQAVANVSGRSGALSASLGAGWYETDGISAFSELRGGNERDGYENTGANLNLNYEFSDNTTIDLRGWYSDGRVNIDGFPPPNFSFADVDELSKTHEYIGYAGLNSLAFAGRLQNRFGVSITDTDRVNEARDGVPVETFSSTGRNRRFEYQGNYTISDIWRSTFGIERENSRYKASSFGSLDPGGEARLNSIYALATGELSPLLTVTAGARHDDHDRFGGASTVSASAVAGFNEDRTQLRGSFSQGFKAPSLFQLLSDFGNTLLQPERSNGGDIGVSQQIGDGSAQVSATLFRRDSRDLINFISCPRPPAGICVNRPFGTYDNVARAQADGYELQFSWQPSTALNVQANYTRVDSENRSRGSANFGKQLPRRPERTGNLLVDYQFAAGASWGLTISDFGKSFDSASNTRVLENYQLIDLRASLPVWENLQLTLRVDNALDEEYETAFGFGQPRRAAYVGLRYGF